MLSSQLEQLRISPPGLIVEKEKMWGKTVGLTEKDQNEIWFSPTPRGFYTQGVTFPNFASIFSGFSVILEAAESVLTHFTRPFLHYTLLLTIQSCIVSLALETFCNRETGTPTKPGHISYIKIIDNNKLLAYMRQSTFHDRWYFSGVHFYFLHWKKNLICILQFYDLGQNALIDECYVYV